MGYTAYCTIDSNMLPCPLVKLKQFFVAEPKGGRFFVSQEFSGIG